MKRLLIALLALAAMTFALAQDQNTQDPNAQAQAMVDMSDMTIAEILNQSPQLSILNALAEYAGLSETLAGEGPYTLFAPTDRAWVSVRGDIISDLLQQPDTLSQILRYHVVPEQVLSSRLVDQLVLDAEQRVDDPLPEEGDEGGEAPLDDQQLGDSASGNLEVEEPFRALLMTGTTSAVTIDTVEGTPLEITSVYTDPGAGTPADVEDPDADQAQADPEAADEDAGQRLGEDELLMGVWEPVRALRLAGVDLAIQDANVVSVDILASNGVIHLIDGLLIPEGVDLGP